MNDKVQTLTQSRVIPIKVKDIEAMGVCYRCRCSGKKDALKHFDPKNMIFGALYFMTSHNHCNSCSGEGFWKRIQ